MKKLLYLILAIIIIVFVCYLCTTERIDNGNSILVNGKNQIENDVKNQEENTEVENETIENEIVENVIDEKNENTKIIFTFFSCLPFIHCRMHHTNPQYI